MKKVIIIGHSAASILGLARSVGRLGCEVVLVYSRSVDGRMGIAESHSCYISECYRFNNWNKDSLLSFLLKYETDCSCKPYLVMTDDKSAYWIASSLEILADKYVCPKFGKKDWCVDQLFDKRFQKARAHECGFKVVDFWSVDLTLDDYTVPLDVVYPCYVKGAVSFNTPKGLQKRCDSYDDLCNHLSQIRRTSPSVVIIEPFVKMNKECGIMAYCDGKRVVAPALVYFEEIGSAHRPGISMVGKVLPLQETSALHQHLCTFLSDLDIHGICNIDLFEVDGEYYFVELNLRYAAYSYGICQGGVNLPAMLIGLRSPLENHVLDKKISYCNETVAQERFLAGELSVQGLLSMYKKTDVSFVYASDDKSPYRHMVAQSLLKKCKSEVMALARAVFKL